MAVKQLRSIYQIKITLAGVKPPIWRTILVPSTVKLADFHLVIQIAMGWTNSHLHQFMANREIYGIVDDEFDMGMEMDMDIKDENLFKLSQLLSKEKDSIEYEYDFGDGWQHKVVLEKILSYDKDSKLPACIKGKRACPPEDCGGIWGYEEFINTIQDPKHPEHQDMLEWVGGSFDPETLDLEEVNKMLIEYCK